MPRQHVHIVTGTHLGVSLDDRRQLRDIASQTSDYRAVLQEILLLWMTSDQQPSWDTLISAVEQCGEGWVANRMVELVFTPG